MPIAGSYRIHRNTLRSAHFVASRLSPSHRYRCTRSSSRSSPRLAGRIVVSLSAVFLSNRIFDVDSTACLPLPVPSSWSHLVVLFRPAFPACLRPVSPCRLISCVSSHRPSSRPSVSPFLDTVGRGVVRGASVLCLLGSALRSVPMSIAGSCRFLCGVPSVCLLCRLGCGEEW